MTADNAQGPIQSSKRRGWRGSVRSNHVIAVAAVVGTATAVLAYLAPLPIRIDFHPTIRIESAKPSSPSVVSHQSQPKLPREYRERSNTNASGENPSDINGPSTSQPVSNDLSSAVHYELIDRPDSTNQTFPLSHLREKVSAELQTTSTPVERLVLGVTFVEPKSLRAQAYDGNVIGYLVVSLPYIPGCEKVLGSPQAFSGGDEKAEKQQAVDQYAEDIGSWIKEAVRGGKVTCPAG